MPTLNGTGPEGKGAHTGRELGCCSKLPNEEKAKKLGKGMGKRRKADGCGAGKGKRKKEGKQ